MNASPQLVSLSGDLLEGVESLHPLQAAPVYEEGMERAALRDNILLALRTKVLPELKAKISLPVFVGVQGGTYVGKSTVFDALAGHLLSPAVVQASSTKHPLVFAHERWRPHLLEENTFGGLICRELEDPKELLVDQVRTELLYFRFHDDNSLSNWALVDSPDFDSALESNLQVARYVTVLSDVTVYVTTAQKYKDRDLVRYLTLLRDLKASVIVVFNMLDEEIVFKTLLDDLKSVVPIPEGDFLVLRVPRSSATHPEDDIRAVLAGPVFDRLAACEIADVKPLLIRRTLEKTLKQVAELTGLFSSEVELKERFARTLDEELEKAAASYDKSFDLALPEETLAIRKVLRRTELLRYLELPSDVQKSSRPLEMIAAGVRRSSEFVRQLLMRFTRSDEGSIEDSPAVLAEYAQARDEADLELISRSVSALRQHLETFFRDTEKTSPLSRAVLSEFFHPDRTREFPAQLRAEFDDELGKSTRHAEKILERVEGWLEKGTVKIVTAVAVLGKLLAGGLVAYVLPPSSLFDILNWLEFAAGYLLGAYAIALTISLVLRRKKQFRKARGEGMRAVQTRTVAAPLSNLLEEILREDNLRAVETTARELGKKLEQERVGAVE